MYKEICRGMPKMELPNRKRRRPKSRFIDAMKEDMREVGVTEEDAVNSEIETADLLR